VGAGQEVVLRAVAEVPDGTGAIVSVEWDVDGAERFPIRDSVDLAPLVVAERRASFAAPGTYFPTVRVTSQRDADAGTAYARIQNLARVRVVVGGG
ncbi:MAG TPA: hypothetical protein VN636_04335, partial [Acidimicrobiia bacterium]|nr:hypothetical protein [Acidimicrobiia bacterium]